jgi:hypothetical protein
MLAPMTVKKSGDALFAPIVRAFSKDPRVKPPAEDDGAGRPRKFGSNGLKVDGRIFAMIVKGRLVVKLPRPRVDALVTSGGGERFDPGHGRVMKEWVTVGPKARASWLGLAREAREFVGGA